MKKHFICFQFIVILSVLLCISCNTSTAFATSGKCGTNVYWTLENGVLSISGRGAITSYSSFPKDEIESIIIEDGITSTCYNAFGNCPALTSVKILGDTFVTLNMSSFNGCTSLETVILSSSLKSIGTSAFAGCTILSSISLPNNITSIGDSAFLGCTLLNNVILPSNLKSLGFSAFKDCTSLQSITIPSGVSSISKWAFYRCTALSNVFIANGVKTIEDEAFYKCSLSTIYIPSSVISIHEYAFGSIRPYSITSNTQILVGLNSLAYERFSSYPKCYIAMYHDDFDFVLPPYLSEISAYAFSNINASSVMIPPRVKTIGSNAFSNCANLKAIYIPASVQEIYQNSFSGVNSDLTILGQEGTFAELLAQSLGYKFAKTRLLD